MSNLILRNSLMKWAVPILFSAFLVLQPTGAALADIGQQPDSLQMKQLSQGSAQHLLLAKRSFSSAQGNSSAANLFGGSLTDKPVQPKNPPPKPPNQPKSTNYNEVAPGFLQNWGFGAK